MAGASSAARDTGVRPGLCGVWLVPPAMQTAWRRGAVGFGTGSSGFEYKIPELTEKDGVACLGQCLLAPRTQHTPFLVTNLLSEEAIFISHGKGASGNFLFFA